MSYLHFTSGTQVFWLLRRPHGMVYKDLIRPRSYLGKLGMSCKVSFFYLQFGSKYDCLRYAHIIMRSRVWFELSDWGATLPRKVIRNTRPSFSHMRGGAGHETIISSGSQHETWDRKVNWRYGRVACTTPVSLSLIDFARDSILVFLLSSSEVPCKG